MLNQDLVDHRPEVRRVGLVAPLLYGSCDAGDRQGLGSDRPLNRLEQGHAVLCPALGSGAAVSDVASANLLETIVDLLQPAEQLLPLFAQILEHLPVPLPSLLPVAELEEQVLGLDIAQVPGPTRHTLLRHRYSPASRAGLV